MWYPSIPFITMRINKRYLHIENEDWEEMNPNSNAYQELKRVAATHGLDLDKF